MSHWDLALLISIADILMAAVPRLVDRFEGWSGYPPVMTMSLAPRLASPS
jgi:hypothetical protein